MEEMQKVKVFPHSWLHVAFSNLVYSVSLYQNAPHDEVPPHLLYLSDARLCADPQRRKHAHHRLFQAGRPLRNDRLRGAAFLS